jgi:hypothetical protein
MNLNTSYLNKTLNKTKRLTTDFKPEFVVAHETAGSGTLDWNLKPSVKASFNYLILRSGEIYHYVNERTHFAWHGGIGPQHKPYSGLSRIKIGNTLYVGIQINIYGIGVELEGPNDGTPITTAQALAFIELLEYFNVTYGIPLTPEYIVEHKAIAPVYKTDPRGYSVSAILSQRTPDPQVIGVPSSITQAQFMNSLGRHRVDLTPIEQSRLFIMLGWYEIDPAFFIALWHAEDTTFGHGILQSQSHMPLNIKAADDEWRPTVLYNDDTWLKAETLQIGAMMSILHLKNVHGAVGRLTVKQIIESHAPRSENDTDQIIKNVLGDMQYIRSH